MLFLLRTQAGTVGICFYFPVPVDRFFAMLCFIFSTRISVSALFPVSHLSRPTALFPVPKWATKKASKAMRPIVLSPCSHYVTSCLLPFHFPFPFQRTYFCIKKVIIILHFIQYYEVFVAHEILHYFSPFSSQSSTKFLVCFPCR